MGWIFLEMNSKGLYLSFEKKIRKSLSYVFTFFRKREIGHFHVVVVDGKEMYKKSVMHVQSCCFANLNLLLFPVLVAVVVSLVKLPNYCLCYGLLLQVCGRLSIKRGIMWNFSGTSAWLLQVKLKDGSEIHPNLLVVKKIIMFCCCCWQGHCTVHPNQRCEAKFSNLWNGFVRLPQKGLQGNYS